MNNSLGLVEVKGFCASIFTVDALLKNTSVSIDMQEINNGNVILKLKGLLPQIQFAVNLAIENANKISSVINYTLLEKLNPSIEKIFFNEKKKSLAEGSTKPEINFKTEIKPLSQPKVIETSRTKTTRFKKVKTSSLTKSNSKVSDEQNISDSESKVSTIERLRLEALGKKSLSNNRSEKPGIKSVQHYNVKRLADLEGLNVHKLRRAARDFDDFPIKGRQISMASREELMVYFKQILPE